MLTVNKDLAKKVADTIDDMASESSNSIYTFYSFCEKHKLFSDKDKRLGTDEYFICCPFHTDDSPSLGLSEGKRRWHCFSCDRSGRFPNFVLEYAKEIEGRDVTYYQILNEMLASDQELQRRVGASTVYVQEKPQDAFTGAAYHRFKLQKSLPKTYPEVATMFLRKKVSQEQIILALMQMQSGISPELIYSSIIENKHNLGSTEEKEQKQYDLTEIMQEPAIPKKIGGFSE